MAASLLDASLEHLEGAGHSLQLLTRVCLVGRCAPGSPAAAFASSCADLCKPPLVTGLLLMLPDGWLQTVEGPTASLVPFLRALDKLQQQGEKLSAVKIVSVQEDVRARYFNSWGSKSVSVVRSNFMEIEGSDSAQAAMIADAAIGAPRQLFLPPSLFLSPLLLVATALSLSLLARASLCLSVALVGG
jgi:hypothetical protein